MNKQRNENQDDFTMFNLNNFRKWIYTQDNKEENQKEILGMKVESKISFKRLTSRLKIQDPDEGEEELLAKEFKQNGGVISDIDGNNFLIEVDSGSFTIHKMYVKMN